MAANPEDPMMETRIDESTSNPVYFVNWSESGTEFIGFFVDQILNFLMTQSESIDIENWELQRCSKTKVGKTPLFNPHI